MPDLTDSRTPVQLPGPDPLARAAATARAYAGVLTLPFRHHVWKGRAGDFAGTGVGSSLDFQDHRTYVPGDDPRHINWQAYARTGHYSMKLYREEVRPVVDLVLDVSASMFAGEPKARRSAELFYFCGDAAVHGAASVTAYLVCGPAHTRLDPATLASHHWTGEAEKLAASAGDAAPGMPAVGSLPLRAGSLRVLVSDLLFPGAPGGTTSTLVANRGRGVVLVPTSAAESSPAWDGNYDFVDAEAGGRFPHRVDPPALRRYLDAYRRHFSLWDDACSRHGVVLARVPAELDFERAVHQEAVPRGALEFS